MQWWNDLVWVGNTLYPRWFVFGVPVVGTLSVLGLIALSLSYWRS